MRRNLFTGSGDLPHRTRRRTGLLIANLGTPDAPTAEALRRYLREFLSDPRVIEYSRPAWWLILNLFILPFRPKKSAALYQKIWTPEGSPLLRITEAQARALKSMLDKELDGEIVVEVAMRYGNPSIAEALDKLRAVPVDRLLVLPMYPQYSSTTTGSTFDAVASALMKWRWVPELRMIGSFADHAGYIDALAESVRDAWSAGGKPDVLLFSFHGIPRRYFLDGDPYHCQCLKTARLVAEQLGLRTEQYVVAFQSLFGREEWIRPYTGEVISDLARKGVTRLDVIAPGFTADCLETLEEIAVEYRHQFESVAQAGATFRYIPALNTRPSFIAALRDIVGHGVSGWPLVPRELAPVQADAAARLEAAAAN